MPLPRHPGSIAPVTRERSQNGSARGRVALGFAAVAVLPLWFLLDLAWAKVEGWWTASDFWLAVVGVATLPLVFALVALTGPRGRALLARRAPAFCTLLLSLVVGWSALEWVTGEVFGGTILFHRNTPNQVREFRPEPRFIRGIEGVSKLRINALGLRGPELPESRDAAYRILCVGGSTTACVYLDDSETWPQLVAAGLNDGGAARVWVGDVGVSGYGTWHHVRFLESTELLEQMDCLVFLIGINDFMRSLQRRQVYSPFGVRPLHERSKVYGVFRESYLRKKRERRDRNQIEDEAGAAYWSRREGWRAQPFVAELPSLEPGISEFRRNLITMVTRCRELGIRPVFLTQPVLWQEGLDQESYELLWLGSLPGGRSLELAALREGMEAFNQVTRDVCADLDAECVDLAAMHGVGAYYYDDCHFTEAGAVRLAELVTEHFRQAGVR